MYGISILSLVSTASLRNWSVFFFLEEGKENSVSRVKGMVSVLHRLLSSREGGPTSSCCWPVTDAAVFQAHPSSRAAPCSSLSALLRLASWGSWWGLSPTPHPRSLAGTLSNNTTGLTRPGPAAPASAPLPAHERAEHCTGSQNAVSAHCRHCQTCWLLHWTDPETTNGERENRRAVDRCSGPALPVPHYCLFF